jgi:hypothetical protein
MDLFLEIKSEFDVKFMYADKNVNDVRTIVVYVGADDYTNPDYYYAMGIKNSRSSVVTVKNVKGRSDMEIWNFFALSM